MVVEPAGPLQIQEDGAAAEERFDVTVELTWVEPPQVGEQLAPATSPFEEWLQAEARPPVAHPTS